MVGLDAARVGPATIPSSQCGSVILNYGSGLPINYGDLSDLVPSWTVLWPSNKYFIKYL